MGFKWIQHLIYNWYCYSLRFCCWWRMFPTNKKKGIEENHETLTWPGVKSCGHLTPSVGIHALISSEPLSYWDAQIQLLFALSSTEKLWFPSMLSKNQTIKNTSKYSTTWTISNDVWLISPHFPTILLLSSSDNSSRRWVLFPSLHGFQLGQQIGTASGLLGKHRGIEVKTVGIPPFPIHFCASKSNFFLGEVCVSTSHNFCLVESTIFSVNKNLTLAGFTCNWKT